MRTFKKTLIAVACFICAVAFLSVLLIEPMLQTKTGYYSDAEARNKLAGQIDFLFIGDSDGMTAFSPQLFDEKTGCFSYNLSGTMMTEGSEYYLLKKELARNPVKTVVLQVSYDTFHRNPAREHGDGDSVTVQRLDSFGERIAYMAQNVKLNDWLDVYSRLLISGMVYWKTELTGGTQTKFDFASRGCHCVSNGTDLSLTREEAIELYNAKTVSVDFVYHHEDEIARILQLCNDYNAEVIVVVLPVSNNHIWEYEGWDVFSAWLADFCEKNHVVLYDFNLYKEKYALFSDEESYKDYAHMSQKGADAFSLCLANVYNTIRLGGNAEEFFYPDYLTMKADSPYMQYLQEK